MKLSRIGTSVAMTAIAALTLAGCAAGGDTGSTDEPATGGDTTTEGGAELSGTLNATGASSMEKAQVNGWIPGYAEVQPGVTIQYTATGSGTGRENFVAGTSEFIGSDRAFKVEEIEENTFQPVCAEGSSIVEFPSYISPIAVAYNLPEVAEQINLDADTIAKIFAGEISNWNDPAIAATNEGVELPDLPINAVHRGDKSGTTGNFLAYLEAAAPDVWTHGTDDQFPSDLGGEAANQTAGVAPAVAAGEGSIGYLDASAVGDMRTVAVKSGNDFVPYSPEAAAAVVAGSPLEEGRADTDVVFDLDYTGVEGAYPIVLVAYLIGCSEYTDSNVGAMVKDYFTYVASAEGQEAAAAEAGNAPLSDEIREQAMAAIDQIK